MPIHEYVCECGESFEELILRASDESEIRCPRCGGEKIERQMSASAVRGSGGGGGGGSLGSSCGPIG